MVQRWLCHLLAMAMREITAQNVESIMSSKNVCLRRWLITDDENAIGSPSLNRIRDNECEPEGTPRGLQRHALPGGRDGVLYDVWSRWRGVSEYWVCQNGIVCLRGEIEYYEYHAYYMTCAVCSGMMMWHSMWHMESIMRTIWRVVTMARGVRILGVPRVLLGDLSGEGTKLSIEVFFFAVFWLFSKKTENM